MYLGSDKCLNLAHLRYGGVNLDQIWNGCWKRTSLMLGRWMLSDLRLVIVSAARTASRGYVCLVFFIFSAATDIVLVVIARRSVTEVAQVVPEHM